MLTDDDKQWLKNILDGRIDASEVALKEHISTAVRNMETKVISEFWKWSRSSDMRTRQALSEASVLGERMLAVEDRITALERKP